MNDQPENLAQNQNQNNTSENLNNFNDSKNQAKNLDNNKNSFDPKNPRVKAAREKHIFNTPLFIALNFIILLSLLAGGITLLILKNPLAWTLLGFTLPPIMFIFFLKTARREIPPNQTSKNPALENPTPNSFTDLLSEELLLTLKESLTPEELIGLLPKTKSGLFLIARFVLPTSFFEQTTSLLPLTTEPIYNSAREIAKETSSAEITGAVLIVATIKNLKNYDLILKQLKLDLTDLYEGINWFNYLNGLVKNANRPLRTGGIARDLSFGFTPTLQRFAINLSARKTNKTSRIQQAENAAIISQMIETLSHKGRENIALVGAYGSGRSSIVEYLAETLMENNPKIPNNLKYSQIYSLNAPSLISASKNPGELEYLIIKILNEIYSAKNIILCLDNAHLFFEDGPSSIDIGNLLTPILESGHIRIILIMDDQKFLEISAKNPALANSLNKIVVHPTDREETLHILMDETPFLEYHKNVVYTYQSLTEAYRLSEQYIHDVVMPGRAKLLLEAAASYTDRGVVTAESVETAVEKSYGVKIKVTDSTEDREKLLNLENLIHERMVDQSEAVSSVANALRRAGAGVKNKNRPIGTFLFLGPTGVGKTELAKTLSEVYFDGENNLIRLDLNEFVSSSDVSRLIKDGASDATSLAAQVMKQPFSVVLLDEIEKAHPSVLTTLLQVLDEGILRDEKNREVSFRNTIIIATSNAGANEIREKLASISNINDFKEELIEKLIENGEFKPEFLNRFDEICLFKPLSKDDLVKILDLIIASTNKTLEPQKISVKLTPEAKKILIEKGYDPKMGARPMRRLVQKTVENIVAAAILSGAATPSSTLTITPSEINIS